MRHGLVSCFALIALFVSVENNSVYAGAWLKPEGHTEIIFSTIVSQAKHRFDGSGKPIANGSFSKTAAQAIVEYGLSDNITLITGLTGQSQNFSNFGINAGSMNWGAMSGVRVKLWSDNPSIISIQTTAEIAGEKHNPLTKNVRFEPPASLDLRLLAGHSFTWNVMPAFIELQTGYRLRSGGHADELRIDLNFGLRPFAKTLLLFQSFNSIAVERDKRFGMKRARQHKLQASLVYEMTPKLSLQAGVFASIAGKESLLERGGILALWWKL